jgi:anti-sigma B factor antagonist
MSAPPGKILVSVEGKCACIKIIGKANCNFSPDFKMLFDELWKKGCTHFVLDLGECLFMDSTFLGILAWSGLKANTPQPDKIEHTLELYNPSDSISELIENLGVMHLFKVTKGQVAPPETGETREIIPPPPTSEACKRASLQAHKLLIQINPANAAKFKDVVAFLAEDLKKLKVGS